MKLTERLTTQISYDIRSRGSTYYLTGRVKLASLHLTEVYSSVRGSRLYEVDLELMNGTIKAFCTCPYAGLCKHVWATILAAEPKGFARAAAELEPLRLVFDNLEDDDDDPDEPPPRRQSVPTRPAPLPKRESWKDQLDALRREVAPTTYDPYHVEADVTDRQVVLVVDLQASEQARKLVIDVNTRERKIGGEWGKPQAKYVTAGYLAKLADPVDRQLVALLTGGERQENYSYGYNSGQGVSRYRVAGPLLATLLPLLAQSGRLGLRRPAKPPLPVEELVADLDPPWVLSIGVTPGDSAQQWRKSVV